MYKNRVLYALKGDIRCLKKSHCKNVHNRPIVPHLGTL